MAIHSNWIASPLYAIIELNFLPSTSDSKGICVLLFHIYLPFQADYKFHRCSDYYYFCFCFFLITVDKTVPQDPDTAQVTGTQLIFFYCIRNKWKLMPKGSRCKKTSALPSPHSFT